MFVFNEISEKFENGSCWVKNYVLGQTFEKPCVCSRDQIFGLILMKLVQSFCLDETLYIVRMGHIRLKTRSLSQIIEGPMLVTKGL